jgi:hypothetical protein
MLIILDLAIMTRGAGANRSWPWRLLLPPNAAHDRKGSQARQTQKTRAFEVITVVQVPLEDVFSF